MSPLRARPLGAVARLRSTSPVPIERLTDLDDPRLRDYQHLRQSSRRAATERRQGIFTVEGALSVEALLASPLSVRSVLVAEEHLARMTERLGPEASILSLPAAAMAELTGVQFHRGVLAVAERPMLPSVSDLVAGARRLLVLEAVNDHENVGALFRNAAAFGVDGVVLDPTTTDPLYRRSTRVSLGHVLRVPFARADHWPAALHDLRAAGVVTIALTPALDATPLGALVADPPERWALLLGAEGPGLSFAALDEVDRHVRIPMAAGVDSINVATAAAIALSAMHGMG